MSRTAKYYCIGLLCAVLSIAVFVILAARTFAGKVEPEVRSRVVRYLEQRFDSRVTLGDLTIQIPKVSAMDLFLHGGSGTIAHVEGRILRFAIKITKTALPFLPLIRSRSIWTWVC